MSKKTEKFLLVTMVVFVAFLLLATSSFSNKRVSPETRAYENEKIEVNQVETYITDFGQYGQSLAWTAGCWWPKGSANAYIFGAGIWVTGLTNTGDTVCVNGYNTAGSGEEFIPGPWQHNQDHLNDPQSHPEDRLYVSTVAQDFAEWPLVDSIGKKIVLGDQDTWCFFNSHEAVKVQLYSPPQVQFYSPLFLS